MNRRNFFGVVGAAIAGAVMGDKSTGNSRDVYSWGPDDLHAKVFVKDYIRPDTLTWGPTTGPGLIWDSDTGTLYGNPVFVRGNVTVGTWLDDANLGDSAPSAELYADYHDAWL